MNTWKNYFHRLHVYYEFDWIYAREENCESERKFEQTEKAARKINILYIYYYFLIMYTNLNLLK